MDESAQQLGNLVLEEIERTNAKRQAEEQRAQRELYEAMDEMREWVLGLCKNNLKQAYIARQAGVSPTALSQWLNRRYPGSEQQVHAKLARWKETFERVEQVTPPPQAERWAETPTGKRIEQALAFAQTEPTIVVLYGNPGVGKTTGIAKYRQEQRNVWVATSSPSLGGMMATVAQVAAAVGLRSLPVTPSQLSRDIIKQVRGSEGLLIIDEAQHLSREAIDELRNFHDSAAIGLCLSGNMHVASKVYGRENSEYLAQFSSRIGNRIVLREPTQGDVDAVVAAWGITGRAEVDFARLIASQPGALRSLRQCLRQASFAAQGCGRSIDVKLMQEARRSLGFEGGL